MGNLPNANIPYKGSHKTLKRNFVLNRIQFPQGVQSKINLNSLKQNNVFFVQFRVKLH